MSQSNDIIDAIITAITPDLSGYTLQGYHRPLAGLDVEELPFGMLFNPSERHTRGNLGAFSEEIAVTLFLVRKQDEDGKRDNVLSMRTDVDAVKARFDTNPRITTTVDYAWVADVDIQEAQSEQIVAVMVIDTVRARG